VRLRVYVLRLYESHPERDLLAENSKFCCRLGPRKDPRAFLFLCLWRQCVTTGPALQPIDESTPTEEFIAWTAERFHNRRMVLTTSFGMEGCALIDMYAKHGAAPTVVYLDTMFLFPETYALRDRMVARYPLVTFVNRGTSLTPEAQDARYGPELWRRDPDLCCQLRKVTPLHQALTGADVWITAIARSQGGTRSAVQLVSWDWQYQVLKICPLATWDRQRVWEYVRENNVPYNELHERGYPTIGCTHCTIPVPGSNPGEYSRAGRWAGTEKSECGLHWESGVRSRELPFPQDFKSKKLDSRDPTPDS
jgi:phosphoadenosine phosphosulfate reductase